MIIDHSHFPMCFFLKILSKNPGVNRSNRIAILGLSRYRHTPKSYQVGYSIWLYPDLWCFNVPHAYAYYPFVKGRNGELTWVITINNVQELFPFMVIIICYVALSKYRLSSSWAPLRTPEVFSTGTRSNVGARFLAGTRNIGSFGNTFCWIMCWISNFNFATLGFIDFWLLLCLGDSVLGC